MPKVICDDCNKTRIPTREQIIAKEYCRCFAELENFGSSEKLPGIVIKERPPTQPIEPVRGLDLHDACPKCGDPLVVTDLAELLDPERQWAVRCYGCPCEVMGKTVKEAREAHRTKVEGRV